MVGIYIAPLSKALYNLRFSFTRDWLPCKAHEEQLGVRSLAQGHFTLTHPGIKPATLRLPDDRSFLLRHYRPAETLREGQREQLRGTMDENGGMKEEEENRVCSRLKHSRGERRCRKKGSKLRPKKAPVVPSTSQTERGRDGWQAVWLHSKVLTDCRAAVG